MPFTLTKQCRAATARTAAIGTTAATAGLWIVGDDAAAIVVTSSASSRWRIVGGFGK